MSQIGHVSEDLVFIFVGSRGLQIGSIFFRMIQDDYVGKRYDILNFFSKVFYICETEREYREIGALIEGYVPEENVLLMGELNTGGDLWSNIDSNDDILANRVFAPLMFAVDQLKNPALLCFYNLSNGKQAGICDYLLHNFPLVKRDMPIYVIATTSVDEGAGALSIYWSILGLNSIIEGGTTKACILLDYEAIGNSIYLHRLKKFEEFDFESYNFVVAHLIYALTLYDREPYANAVPFCQLIDSLVIFNDMKFIIPFMTMPRRELIEDEKFSDYLNELVNDCNLFSTRFGGAGSESRTDIPKISIANAFIAFGEKQDTEYLNLIRQNLPPITEFLPGTKAFYTYPRGEPFSIFMENNSVFRQYFQDLLEKFDILMSHHSYLHILEDLGITKESFSGALERLVSLIDAYQECEDLLYDDEEYDYEAEIQKYTEMAPPLTESPLTEGESDTPVEEVIQDADIVPESEKTQATIPSELARVKDLHSHSPQPRTTPSSPTPMSSSSLPSQLPGDTKAPASQNYSQTIANLNETTIKTSPRVPEAKIPSRSRSPSPKRTSHSLISRDGETRHTESPAPEEIGALQWLEMRASKEKERVAQEKAQIEQVKAKFDQQKREFEEAQEKLRLAEATKKKQEDRKNKEKKKELRKLAKMFESC